MKRKRIISSILLVLILVSTIVTAIPDKVFTVGLGGITYNQMLKTVERLSGEMPDTPTPHFDLHFTNEDYPLEKEKAEVRGGDSIWDARNDRSMFHNIDVVATVPVGTKITTENKSKLGSGEEFTMFQWQNNYSPDEETEYGKSNITYNETLELTADKPGYITIAYNVADDYVAYYKGTNQKIEYDNWTNKGNWVASLDDPDRLLNEWFFTITRIKVVEPGQSNIVVNDLEIVDKETKEVVDSFKRELDKDNPFDTSKQKLIRTTKTGERKTNAPMLDKNKDYLLRGSYQFISFSEGEFDITDEKSMTDKQRNLTTEINVDKLNTYYSYDKMTDNDDPNKHSSTGQESSNNTKVLKNLEKAEFEWDYVVPEDVENLITISVRVPDIYDDVNDIKEDDWATVYGRLDNVDLAAVDPLVLLDENGKPTKRLTRNKNHKAVFTIKHIMGETPVGEDSKDNPKVTIDINIFDKEGKQIYKEKAMTDKVLNPDKIVQIPSKAFKTDSDEIRVCATINPIHKEKGFNFDISNDRICRTFSATASDIGMKAPVTLLRDGSPQDFVGIHMPHQLEFGVKHYTGDDVVGEGTNENPRVRVNVTTTDGSGKIQKETIVLNKNLNPGETHKIRTNRPFTSTTGTIKSCATIDPIHAKLGYNIANGNDTICAEFGFVKNYSVQHLRVTPGGVNLAPGQASITIPVSFNYTIGHEDGSGVPLGVNPIVEIKQGNKVIWRGTQQVNPNSSTVVYQSFPLKINEGNNNFTVEVNPTRVEKEFKPGMPNPYVDNKKSVDLLAKGEFCPDCTNQRTKNTWSERFTWVHREHFWVYPEEGSPYCSSRVISEWSNNKTFKEEFKITSVKFNSKWSKDVKGGPVNFEGFTPKIKSGYGFEVEVKTNYNTDRIDMPNPQPYSGSCNGQSLSRSPGVDKTDMNEQVYLELPFMKDNNGNNVCYLLEKVSTTGAWYNANKTFRLYSRTGPNGGSERKIYVKEHSRPGIYPVQIRTSVVNGYHPNTPVNTGNKKLMQDCKENLKIEVLPQDDIKSHIIQ